MKKTISVLLCLFFLFNLIGYPILLSRHRSLMRQITSLQCKPEVSKFCVLRLSDEEMKKDFKRLDKKEFRYLGNLYDIIHESKVNGLHVFYCYHDVPEEDLLFVLKNTGSQKEKFASGWNLITLTLPVSLNYQCYAPASELEFPIFSSKINDLNIPAPPHPPETC